MEKRRKRFSDMVGRKGTIVSEQPNTWDASRKPKLVVRIGGVKHEFVGEEADEFLRQTYDAFYNINRIRKENGTIILGRGMGSEPA